MDCTLKHGESVRSRPPEDEEATETTGDELTTAPIPCHPALLGGRRWENIRSKIKFRKKGAVEGRIFKI